MAQKYAIKTEGADYYSVIIAHLMDMGRALKEGLDVGHIGTKNLMAYHQMIIHYESLVTPFMTKEFYEKRAELEKRLPAVSKTWSGNIVNQMQYFNAISDLFQLLMIFSYNEGVLKLRKRPDYSMNEGMF